MDQKERILSLVKEGTLSMEEALELLEHLDSSEQEMTDEENTTQETSKDEEVSKEDNDSINIQEKINELIQQKEITTKEQVIAGQRQRELEILQDFGGLTSELEKDLDNYRTQVSQLDEQIAELDEQIQQLKQQKHQEENAQWQDVAEEIKKTVQDVTKKTIDEGEQLFHNQDQIKDKVSNFVKGVLNHYTVRSVGDYLGIQWAKATTQHQTYEFDAKALSSIELTMPEGEWEIKTHPKQTVYIEGQWAIYGNSDELADEVERWHQASIRSGLLQLITESGQMAFKGTMYVPESGLDHLTFKIDTGLLTLHDVITDRLVIEGKLIQSHLNHVKVNKFYLNLINGKLKVDQSSINMSTLSVVKGDVRYSGPVANITSSIIRGDYYITKEDHSSSELNLSSVKGQVKFSLPETVGLQGQVKQTSGKVFQRLLNGQLETSKGTKVTQVLRQVPKEDATVTLQVSLKSGDMYLKDYQ